MTAIPTVLGDIDSARLGRTYMHEHIFTLTADMQRNYPNEWGDEDARIADAVAKLRALANQGVATIVDPTVVGLGRYIPRIVRVAQQVPGLNIVVATGLYTYDEVPFYFRFRGPTQSARLQATVDPMVELFVSDITEGITGTGVRAGMLKCAIDHQGLTPGVERTMRAVARAHHLTGTPVTVHTHPHSQTGLVVRRVLCEEEGVAPHRIVLAHSGDTTDVDHLCELAEQGFVLGMDRFGINVETTFDARAQTVIALCRRGYADTMVLSHDAACYIDWMDPAIHQAMPQWHYLHLANDVLPYLREHGVTQEQIDTMLEEVPRRLFEGTSDEEGHSHVRERA